jgi:hypothetical protein
MPQVDALETAITQDEIMDAMAALKNSKAPSPVTTIPSELIKYGGTSLACLPLMPCQCRWLPTAAVARPTGARQQQVRQRASHRRGLHTDLPVHGLAVRLAPAAAADSDLLA